MTTPTRSSRIQPAGRSRRPIALGGVWGRLATSSALVIGPFVLLVRGAIVLERNGLGPWLAIFVAASLTAAVLTGYAALLARRFTGRWRVPRPLGHGMLLLVGSYCAYGVIFLSASNAKSPGLAAEFHSLDPTLRLALSTLILTDRQVVLTDLSRTLADYPRMGLRENAASLHRAQRDGYAHAVDLRTVNRPAWRNLWVTWYCRLMGLEVSRHRGTADHLHVAVRTSPLAHATPPRQAGAASLAP